MRALRFDRFGEPADVLHIADAAPAEPGRNEVRVRMRLAPINPSDLMVVRGKYGKLPTLPATPGFEGMGVVEQSGGGLIPWLRGLKPGRRVAVVLGEGGSWQESVIVSARQAIPLPDAIPDEQAASFFVNPITALVMTRHLLKTDNGAVLVQTAAGSALGRMVIRLARRLDFKVINLVRRREQIAELEALGAWKVLCTRDADTVERIRELTGGKGAEYGLDAVGGATGLAAFKGLGTGGRLVVYGTLSGEPIPVDPRELISLNKTVEGFWLGPWVRRQGVFTMLKLFRQVKRLMIEDVLTSPIAEIVPLERHADAVALAEKPGKPGKVLLRFSET